METVGERLLYVDTDSNIFVHSPGDVVPPTGNFVGGLTSELKPGQFIRKFVSLGRMQQKFYSRKKTLTFLFPGPKSYAYQTNNLQTVCEVKGFTLGGHAEAIIKFESMLAMLNGSGPFVVPYPNALVRNKRKYKINQVDQSKRFAMTYDKRRNTEWETLPYGNVPL